MLLSATPTITDEAVSFILFYSFVQHVLYSYNDHNFILDDPAPMKQAGWLRSPDTGIRMEVETTQPGIQLYTGNP